jgi:membrane protease YdiL (CAAX protease family)
MSTHSALPDPDDIHVLPEEPEPFLAELADDEPPIRLRRRRPARPPEPPHPGFWWAILWCVLMYMVAQIVPAFAVITILAVIEGVRAGSFEAAMQWLGGLNTNKSYLLPLMGTVEAMMILSGWVVIRLIVGRDWAREVAVRLPTVTHTVLSVIAWPALAITSAGAYLLVKGAVPGFVELPDYVVTIAAVLGIVSLCWVLVRLTTGRDWTKVLARQRPAVQLVVTLVAGVGVLALAVQLFRFFRPHVVSLDFLPKELVEGAMESAVQDFRRWPPWLGVLIVGLGPGIGEELWCRAFFGRGLVGRHGVVMGVVLTSLFFGAIHVDPHQGMMAAVMGLALHFSYLTTRSLFVPILLHFLNNSLSMVGDKLSDLLGRPGEKFQHIDADAEAIPWLVFLTAAGLLAAVGWALYASRGRLARTDGSDLPPWQPPFAGVAHPPPGSGTSVVYPWPGLLPCLAVIAGVVALGCALYWS